MIADIPLISIGFDGYPLEQVIEGLAKTRSKSVILCAIDGFTKDVIPEEMSREEWQEIKQALDENDLSLFGLAGHCNVSAAADGDKARKRMRFVSFLGGKNIDLNAGPKGTESAFYRNVVGIGELAEELALSVSLETHGDLVESGKTGHALLKKVESKRIKIGYDPANVYFYSRGAIDPVEDIRYALEDISIIHFKGVAHDGTKTKWRFPGMKESAIDYEKFFRVLQESRYQGMVAIEVEQRLRYEPDKGFFEDPVWPEERIIQAYDTEIEYLSERLSWMRL